MEVGAPSGKGLSGEFQIVAANDSTGWPWYGYVLLLIVILGALATTIYLLRKQITKLTGIDLVLFFDRAKQTVGLVKQGAFDDQAVTINFAPDACPDLPQGTTSSTQCGTETNEQYQQAKAAFVEPNVLHCGETCEATTEGVAKWERPSELRGFRYRPGCSQEGLTFATKTVAHMNTNNALEVKVPSGPGLYELILSVGDCQHVSDSVPRLDLIQEDGSVVPLLTDSMSLDVDLKVVRVTKEVRITGDIIKIRDPRTPIANAAVGTTNELVQPQGVNFLYVHRKDQQNYSVAKAEVQGVVETVRELLPGARLAAVQDIEALAASDVSFCACGWVLKTRTSVDSDLTTGYPSIPGTSQGCGNGQRGFMNCGDDGPNWAEGKAGVYFVVFPGSKPLSEIKTLLETRALTGTVLPYYRVLQPTRLSALGMRRVV